jgi:hypothetical protein
MDIEKTPHNAQLLQELRDFSNELINQPLSVSEFKSRFKVFHDWPIRAALDDLSHLTDAGYLEIEVKLSPEFFKTGTAAITNILKSLEPFYPKYNGVSRRLYAKTIEEQPLSAAEVRNLPDKVMPYLIIRLSNIAERPIREWLAIYNDPTNIEPSRLVKVAKTTAAGGKLFHASLVTISHDRIVYVQIDGGRQYRLSRKLRTDSTPHSFINYMLTHPITRTAKADIEIATGSDDITEQVRASGFDEFLKAIFFHTTTEKKVYFNPSPNLTAEQVRYIENYKWDKVGKAKKK